MSADLVKTVLLEDSRIAQLTAEECFAVQSSAQQSTYQQYNVTANSNSSLVWSVQIPSENIVIDRHALLSTDITFQITLGGASNLLPAGGGALSSIFNYGLTDSVQAFPLQSLFTTLQATINNTSVSTNYQDVMPMLSRMYDKRTMSRWNSMTPSYADSQYANYADSTASNNNPLADYRNASYDIDFVPRGAFPITFNGGTFNGTAFGPGTETPEPPAYTSTTDVYKLVFTIKVTEPFLFLSPFINNNPENQAGLLGINNISLVANIDQSMKRFFSTANTVVTANAVSPAYISNIQLGNTLGITGLNGQLGFGSTRLLLNFLSLSPEQYSKISTRNVINYMEYPRYLTQLTSTGALGAKGSATARQTISTSSIQLNQVPDLILVCGRVPMGQQTIANTSSFLSIKNISINFNNQSGLLASATTQDLFDISQENGSSQNFYEFSGSANINNNTTGLADSVSTTGSLLVLNPVRDFSLPSYLSSSSLGQYQLQMNVTFENQYPFAVTPEIVIITCNSGVFATTQGTSAIYTGILSKEVVLKTKEQNPVPHLDSVEYKRLVGGRLGNMGMSNIRALLKSHIKKHRMGAGIGSPSSGGMHHPVRDAVKNKLMKHLM